MISAGYRNPLYDGTTAAINQPLPTEITPPMIPATDGLTKLTTPTLRGREQQDEVQNDPMIIGIEYATREQRNIHKLQNRALIGLALALLENLIIVVMLVIGVAELWFDIRFAVFTLAITIPPSVAAWTCILKWAFPAKK